MSPARTPDTSAAGRLQRLLALVPWVLDHPGATVDEVCERFEMTREMLIADVELLYVTGVPPYGPGDLMEAWVDGDKGKSWAEGRWLVTDAGRMCLKANWHSDQGVFPGRTCFSHRIGDGTIYQKREPDGQWYVFRHANSREDDEAKKLVSADLVSSRIDSLRPSPRQKQSMAK